MNRIILEILFILQSCPKLPLPILAFSSIFNTVPNNVGTIPSALITHKLS